MVYGLLMVGLVVCALMALRSTRLVVAAIWLAGASALLAVGLYALGAVQVAVMELSIGAGLVTVLFVFVIGIMGDEAIEMNPLVPRVVGGGLVLLSLLSLSWLNFPLIGVKLPSALGEAQATFSAVLWQQRGLDVLVQSVLIFAGALGALGLLKDVGSRQATAPSASAALPEFEAREARA